MRPTAWSPKALRGKLRALYDRTQLQPCSLEVAKGGPDGESKVWWKRLKKALGTMSSDFVNASLLQLQAAAQLPGGGISETTTNAALALIEAAAPRNEK